MQKFIQPDFKLIINDEANNYAKYIVKPLERGFGYTLGNAIRRTLLSSILGAAVYGYRIDGASHEYTTMEGISESLVRLTLNLKELVFKIDRNIIEDDEPVTLTIKSTRVEAITGASIECPTGVTVVNPEHIIFHHTQAKPLNAELFIQNSRGYVPFTENRSLRKGHDMIMIDSNYSCVEKVAYHVKPMQVGDKQNYENLEIEVKTNGSVTPNDAIGLASQILMAHLAFFEDLNESCRQQELINEEVVEENDDLNNLIYDLELSQRSENCLIKSNINTLRDLINHTEQDIQNIHNLGRKSLREIKDKIYQLNLDFKRE